MCDSLLADTDEMGYLEGQSRRNNLVIDGIEESQQESWSATEEKVKELFRGKMHLQQNIEIERANKSEKPEGGRP